MKDLFGNEGPPARGSLRPVPAAAQPDLFTAAAESHAIASGRPVSQERIRVLYPGADGAAYGAGYRCLHDHPLVKRAGGLVCPECDP